MSDKQKLELTWIGKNDLKYDVANIEPRILIENPEKLYGDPNTENMLIHGDNLLALKSLEQEYSGKVKCIYIDPPYNTGNAFEHYDDNLEHSIWLELMYKRLQILHKLLQEDGVIFVQIDDQEQAYLKVIMDEIFGRSNFINLITVKTKIGGVSGSSEGKSLKDATEFINVFAKNKEKVLLNDVYNLTPLYNYIKSYNEQGKSWKYTSVITKLEGKKLIKKIGGFAFYSYDIFESKSVLQFARDNGITEEEVYANYADKIFRTTNAQSSIRKKVIDELADANYELVSVEYIPIKGKNKDKLTEVFYKGTKRNMIMLLSDVVTIEDGKSYYKEKITTLWDDIQYNNLAKEGDVSFPNGKKPELLIKNILELASNKGDIVLDSFLGSGSTAAVAHKMNRKWIGIELGEHCYTHCLPRLQRVIDGEQSGISNSVNWQGGGGFKFYELAPSLLKKDSFGNWIIDEKYNANMLGAAICKHEGFTYNPDEELHWKQGQSTEKDFVFVTTSFLTVEYLDKIHEEMKSDESLLICCKAYQEACDNRYNNITIKKIPQMILDKCEFGKDDYNLNIIDLPNYEEDGV